MIKLKAFTAYDHGKNLIDLRDIGTSIEMIPTELHYKEDGSLNDKPSFVIVLEHPSHNPVYGQITLEMLNDTMNDLGYTIIKNSDLKLIKDLNR